MIDVQVLSGAAVRSGDRFGRIARVSLPWVTVGWQEAPGHLRERSYLRSDPELKQLEVLTIPEGWVTVAVVCGTGSLQGDD